MGVIHKLKPEVRDFIIEQKRLRPSLSCRAFTLLIAEQLKVKVSKSSINAIFREAGLSMPIGRRVKHKKQKVETLGDRVKLALQAPVAASVEIKSEPVVEQQPALILPLVKQQEPQQSAEEKILQEIQQQHDRLAQESAQQAEEAQEKVQQQEQLRKFQEQEAKRKVEEESKRLVVEQQAAEEARRKEEDARLAVEQQAAEEARFKKEEKAAQEAGLKEEQEKWVRRAEEERRIAGEIARKAQQEPQQSAEEKILEEIQQQQDRLAQESAQQVEEVQRKIQIEEAKRNEEAAAQAKAQRKEEDARLAAEQQAAEEARFKKEEKAAQGATVRAAEEPLSGKDDEFASVSILPQSRLSSGAVLLKAIDCLIGGSSQINAILCKRINRDPAQMLSLTQALIFNSLFEKNKNFSDLWSLVGKQYSQETLQSYSEQVQQVRSIKLDILHVISNIFTETRGVKVHFPDGDIVYLDGQLHTTWSTASLPSDFSGTVYGLKNYLNRYFFEAAPLVLFTAPGYDIPPKEFFTLLFNFSNLSKAPDVLTLYGNKLEDLESISLHSQKSYSVVFCLWPWQFTSQRKVKKLGDFKPSYIESVNKNLYLAEIEMDLLQPSLGQSIALRGCAVKTNLNEKTRLVILSNNMPVESLDKLVGLYLSHWPNLEESFQDFSRKIELSTYTGNAQKFASLSDSATNSEPVEELEEIFANYIKMLDTYLRWYFLPSGYQQKDFVFTSENFYKLSAMFVANKSRASVKMQVASDYPYLKDLEYLIRRFNERQIDLEEGQLFCLENISSK